MKKRMKAMVMFLFMLVGVMAFGLSASAAVKKEVWIGYKNGTWFYAGVDSDAKDKYKDYFTESKKLFKKYAKVKISGKSAKKTTVGSKKKETCILANKKKTGLTRVRCYDKRGRLKRNIYIYRLNTNNYDSICRDVTGLSDAKTDERTGVYSGYMQVGSKGKFALKYSKVLGKCTTKYSSSDKNVVSIDKNGVFTATGYGKAVVTANLYKFGKKIATDTFDVYTLDAAHPTPDPFLVPDAGVRDKAFPDDASATVDTSNKAIIWNGKVVTSLKCRLMGRNWLVASAMSDISYRSCGIEAICADGSKYTVWEGLKHDLLPKGLSVTWDSYDPGMRTCTVVMLDWGITFNISVPVFAQ